MSRHGQPAPGYQDKQHPLGNKQSFFLKKRAISVTSGFCLLLPISCPFCDRVWYNHRIWCWCQARGIRLLYSLAGASGTHVGKTFSFRILLGLARMLQMCHSREVPHFNLLYSFFVDFFSIPDITSCTFILSHLLFSEDNNPNNFSHLGIAIPLILLVALWILWSSQSLRWQEMAGPQQSAWSCTTDPYQDTVSFYCSSAYFICLLTLSAHNPQSWVAPGAKGCDLGYLFKHSWLICANY